MPIPERLLIAVPGGWRLIDNVAVVRAGEITFPGLQRLRPDEAAMRPLWIIAWLKGEPGTADRTRIDYHNASLSDLIGKAKRTGRAHVEPRQRVRVGAVIGGARGSLTGPKG